MKNKNRTMIKVLLIALVFVAAGVVYSCAAGSKRAEPEVAEETFAEESTAAKAGEDETEAEAEPEEEPEADAVCVHVCGSVKTPGVYYLQKGARVHEAVEMAGGFLPDAAESYVNLAKEAEDGSQIYIPSKEEAKGEQAPQTEAQTETEKADGRVNLNTASAEELKSLPGIGESKAKAIVAYREKHGKFASPEDITKVTGIKSGSYERIKDLIKV